MLSPELSFDPEVVFYIDYETDGDGWAHSMQVHPDGAADYIRYRPDQLDHGVRWICRTPDQDALGLILPSTAEPEGYTAEKAKGNIKTLAAGGTMALRHGHRRAVGRSRRAIEATIEEILGSRDWGLVIGDRVIASNVASITRSLNPLIPHSSPVTNP